MMKISRALAALGLVCAVGAANAALVSKTVNGGAVIYDDVNNVTWLQDWTLGGNKNWYASTFWAGGLSFAGVDDWRLPTLSEFNGLYGSNHLWGLSSVTSAGFTTQLVDYWTSTEYQYGYGSAAYHFSADGSYINWHWKDSDFYAVAVRSGDIAPVPVPATLPLLIAGLAALGASARRRKTLAVQP